MAGNWGELIVAFLLGLFFLELFGLGLPLLGFFLGLLLTAEDTLFFLEEKAGGIEAVASVFSQAVVIEKSQPFFGDFGFKDLPCLFGKILGIDNNLGTRLALLTPAATTAPAATFVATGLFLVAAGRRRFLFVAG